MRVRFDGLAAMPPGWRELAWFWVAVLSGLALGAGVLQMLGPPPPRPAAVRPQRPASVNAPSPATQEAVPPPVSAATTPHPESAAPPSGPAPGPAAAPPPASPGRAAPQPGDPLPLADAALQEPAPGLAGAVLPRIAPDGRIAMRVFAAPFDAADPRPKVAVLLAGLGMAEADSEEAIRATPPAVSLAFSPYAPRPAPLVGRAHQTGHETLIALPMEPLGYPLDDAGNQAMLTGAPAARNEQRLFWALSRTAGAVGATGALGGLRGERFAASPQMGMVLDALAGRGLLYIDPRPTPDHSPAAKAPPGQLRVDVVVDDPPIRSAIEARLARLEQVARDHGSALGLAGPPVPVTIERLAAWAAALPGHGIALVPVSALVPPLTGGTKVDEPHSEKRGGIP